MKTFFCVLACAAGASAFAPAAKSTTNVAALNSVFDDYVGAVDFRGKKMEFDPLNLSETYSPFVPFFREAELRHGRTAMLAVMGYIVADLVRIPGEAYSFAAVPHAVDAHDALLKTGPMYQIAGFIALFDLIITAPAIQALGEGEREAGDLGWTTFGPDPETSKAAFDKKRVTELLNGRLAMIAVGGIATQTVLTGHGFPYV